MVQVAEHLDNPRDELGDLTEHAASIKTLGLRQPILVVPVSTFQAASAIDIPAHARSVVLAATGAGPHASWPGLPRCLPGCAPTSAPKRTPRNLLAENVHRAPAGEARAMASDRRGLRIGRLPSAAVRAIAC
jgi:hypothetical protein